METNCLIGTSGWDYPHWREVFYPAGLPHARWFAAYAERFPTVEINYSFYRLPDEVTVERWRAEAPAGFVYAVKANRYITHVRRLKDCAEPVARFLDRCRLLGGSLGPILYQLPPNWRLNTDRLAAFADLLPDDLVHVFEFRDERWCVDEVRDLLSRRGLGFCVHDHPGTRCPGWVTGRVAYYRFHGSARGRNGGYTGRELARHAADIGQCLDAGHDAFAYYNNDALGRAVHDALALRALVDARDRSCVGA